MSIVTGDLDLCSAEFHKDRPPPDYRFELSFERPLSDNEAKCGRRRWIKQCQVGLQTSRADLDFGARKRTFARRKLCLHAKHGGVAPWFANAQRDPLFSQVAIAGVEIDGAQQLIANLACRSEKRRLQNAL